METGKLNAVGKYKISHFDGGEEERTDEGPCKPKEEEIGTKCPCLIARDKRTLYEGGMTTEMLEACHICPHRRTPTKSNTQPTTWKWTPMGMKKSEDGKFVLPRAEDEGEEIGDNCDICERPEADSLCPGRLIKDPKRCTGFIAPKPTAPADEGECVCPTRDARTLERRDGKLWCPRCGKCVEPDYLSLEEDVLKPTAPADGETP